MKFLLPYLTIAILMVGCSHATNELEVMTEDVLKAKEGVDIKIKPIPKDKKCRPKT